MDGASPLGETLNAAQLSAIAAGMYEDGPLLLRTLQRWRPYICPFERLLRHVQNRSRVLDIGCGAGLLFSLMAGLGFEFEGLGVDSSKRAIDLARYMARRAAVRAPQAKLSFECLRLPAALPCETFDAVFLIDVLHHISQRDQRRFLHRAIARLKPGGTLVYKDMCLRPRWRAYANRLHDLVVARQWITYLPVRTLEQWAQSEGMVVIFSEDLSRFCYGHELRVLSRLSVPPGGPQMLHAEHNDAEAPR